MGPLFFWARGMDLLVRGSENVGVFPRICRFGVAKQDRHVHGICISIRDLGQIFGGRFEVKNRYCIGSKLPEDTFRALVRAYFMGKTTEDAAQALKVSQGSVKNLYRRLTYRLIDDFRMFEFYRELLADCFETGGHRVEALKRCLWLCPGDLRYDAPDGREHCDDCPFATRFRAFPDQDESVQTMYYERRSLAPLNSFSFVNRAAYAFIQRYLVYGSREHRRGQANKFIAKLKARPLGSSGSKSQIAHRYVESSAMKPHWYVVGQGPEYYLPNHDMM